MSLRRSAPCPADPSGTAQRAASEAARPSAPMRILMIPVGSAGDVHPHVGIGLALKRRGHDVSVLTSAWFEPLCARVGLPLVPIGTAGDYHRYLKHPGLWRPHRALGVIGEAIRPHVTEIARVLREQAAGHSPLLVAHPLAFGARAAQEALGLRLVTLHLQAAGFVSEHEPPVAGQRRAAGGFGSRALPATVQVQRVGGRARAGRAARIGGRSERLPRRREPVRGDRSGGRDLRPDRGGRLRRGFPCVNSDFSSRRPPIRITRVGVPFCGPLMCL